MKNYKIVIVDQERVMKKLKGVLERDGFVISTSALRIGLPSTTSSIDELVRFDILLSEECMAATLLKIHSFSGGPFFVLSARIDNTAQLARLEKGIRNNIENLIDPAAVGNHFKAESTPKNLSIEEGKLLAGPISIDPEGHSVSVFESEVHLTPTEFKILKLLAATPEKVITRDALTTVLYGPGFEDRYRSIDCHIAHIREKLARHLPGRKVIRSVYGTGYAFTTPEAG